MSNPLCALGWHAKRIVVGSARHYPTMTGWEYTCDRCPARWGFYFVQRPGDGSQVGLSMRLPDAVDYTDNPHLRWARSPQPASDERVGGEDG